MALNADKSVINPAIARISAGLEPLFEIHLEPVGIRCYAGKMSKKPLTDLARKLGRISIHDLRRRITSLRSADLESLSDEAVTERIKRIMDRYPFQLRTLVLTGIYRARANQPGEIFSSAQQLWYPPAVRVTSPSRLNRANQVRFYAANSPNAAMLELRPLEGGIITVLLATTKDAPFVELSDTIFIGLERSLADEVEHLGASDLFRSSPSFRMQVGEGNYKKWRLIDDYFDDILTAPVTSTTKHLYKPTMALADVLFSCPNLDVINYPSVESDLHGINLCTLPETADRLFRPFEAWMIRLQQKEYHDVTSQELHRIEFVRRSHPIGDDGAIKWLSEGEGLNPAEILRFTQHRLKTLDKMPTAAPPTR